MTSDTIPWKAATHNITCGLHRSVTMKAWYNQPEHRALETLARREILDDYTIEIAHITRSYTKASSHFKATEADERGADLLAANPEAAIA
jgi:hypothetical protein